MKKLIIAAFLTISLTGCLYQAVDSNDIELATKLCIKHGGVYEIHAHAIGHETVTCVDRYWGELTYDK